MSGIINQVGETQEIVIEDIIFKREDGNPTGSVKDRGISHQLDWVKKQGIKDLVISSSGNAAISACYFCQKLGLNLSIFVSPGINKKKLDIIHEYPFRIFVSPRAKSDSIKFARKNNFFHLRASTDPRGKAGYQTIAKEITTNHGQINFLFISVSSGTTLIGTAEGFKTIGYLPQIHAVQTTAVNTIAKTFDYDFISTKTSLASALVAKYTPCKKQAINLIKESGGFGWIISDQEILPADQWLEEKGIITSFEGGAALAAIWKAKKNNWQLGKTACLLTGKRYR